MTSNADWVAAVVVVAGMPVVDARGFGVRRGRGIGIHFRRHRVDVDAPPLVVVRKGAAEHSLGRALRMLVGAYGTSFCMLVFVDNYRE